jgi:hypothetical protein
LTFLLKRVVSGVLVPSQVLGVPDLSELR